MKTFYIYPTTCPTKFQCSWKLLLLLIINYQLSIINCFSQQAPGIEWQNTIGGNYDDQLYSMQQTDDGGYILGGWSFSDSSGDKSENHIGLSGTYDFWIVKTDSVGNVQWENTIGGNDYERLEDIRQTTDGGYIMGGGSVSDSSGDKTENNVGEGDIWLVKTDSAGNIQWQNTIGGNNGDDVQSIEQTSDGGYILGGSSDSNISGDKTENSNGYGDYWIIKTDSLGNIQWQNTIGGNESDILASVRQTIDGGYILAGSSYSDASGDKTEDSNGSSDLWIVKTDSAGNIQWQNTIGGNKGDYNPSIRQTLDGGYIMGCRSSSDSSGDKTENNIGIFHDYWVIKTDSLGNIVWQNTIGGSNEDIFWSVEQTNDGSYIIGGYSDSNISGDKTENCLGGKDYWIIKIDSSGNITWQNTIGGSSGSDVRPGFYQTKDGGYILGGSSNSNISVDKTENCLGELDYWLVKLLPDTITGIQSAINNPQSAIAISPNPSSGIFQITFPTSNQKANYTYEVVNTLGQTVFKARLPASPRWGEESTTLPLNLSFLPKGIYVIKINDGVSITGNKIIIQ